MLALSSFSCTHPALAGDFQKQHRAAAAIAATSKGELATVGEGGGKQALEAHKNTNKGA